jgi:hypothetical protein
VQAGDTAQQLTPLDPLSTIDFRARAFPSSHRRCCSLMSNLTYQTNLILNEVNTIFANNF